LCFVAGADNENGEGETTGKHLGWNGTKRNEGRVLISGFQKGSQKEASRLEWNGEKWKPSHYLRKFHEYVREPMSLTHSRR